MEKNKDGALFVQSSIINNFVGPAFLSLFVKKLQKSCCSFYVNDV